MNIEIKYCSMWGYEPKAVSLATKLLTLKQKVKSLKLIPASGGCFEITVNDSLIYSKLATGQFPDEQMIFEKAQTK